MNPDRSAMRRGPRSLAPSRPDSLPRRAGVARLLPALLLLAGCREAMYDQPRFEPYEPTRFFENGTSARLPVPGTVARGHLRDDDHRDRGKVDGQDAETFPGPVTARALERGRERYMIFCAPCHGAVGDGKGMIVQRGFSPPPSFHTDALREMPVGHYFDVITNGYGAMYPYGYRVKIDDRWAIIAYIRALQLSQHAELASLPDGLRRRVERDLAGRASEAGGAGDRDAGPSSQGGEEAGR